MDGLEGNFTRPRQVRYQAALRPDKCTPLILRNFFGQRNRELERTVSERIKTRLVPEKCIKTLTAHFSVSWH